MPRISVDLRLRLSPNEVAAPRPPSFARILAQLPTSSSKLLPVSSICEAPVSKRCVAEQVRARQKRVRVPDLTGGGETPFYEVANKTDGDETEMPNNGQPPPVAMGDHL